MDHCTVSTAACHKKFPLTIQAVAVLIMLCILPAHAYRPFTTEDAGVAGKDVTQMEVSWDYINWGHGDDEHNFLSVLIHGFTERLELSVEVPYVLHNYSGTTGENDPGDVNLVGKYLLQEEGKQHPALAIKASAKSTTGNARKGLGTGAWDYSLYAVASKNAGDFDLHGMIGYTLIGNSGNPDINNLASYSIAADYKMTDKFHLGAEVGSHIHPDRLFYANPSSALVGVTYTLSDAVILDAAVMRSLNSASPFQCVTVGMSITL